MNFSPSHDAQARDWEEQGEDDARRERIVANRMEELSRRARGLSGALFGYAVKLDDHMSVDGAEMLLEKLNNGDSSDIFYESGMAEWLAEELRGVLKT